MQLVDGGAVAADVGVDQRADLLGVEIEDREVEAPLVAEGVVQALPADLHGREQVAEGGSLVAALPEQRHRALTRDLRVEFLDAWHERYDLRAH